MIKWNLKFKNIIKTVVHLHNEILCSRKKERAPTTICDSMDGTGEYCAK